MHYSDYRLLKLRIIYLLYNIVVLNTQRFGAFVLEFAVLDDEVVYTTRGKCSVY